MPFCTAAELGRLWHDVGLDAPMTGALVVRRTYADYEDFWEPFTAGVGPGGAYCVSLEPDQQQAVREECFPQLGSPVGAFQLTAQAWLVRGTV